MTNNSPHKAKNCLIIILDTVRAKSTYIKDKAATPRLKELAREGTSFEKATTPAPWTLPSHASIYTGLYPTEHGATHQHKWLNDEHKTLPERASDAGIRTGLFTANMFLTESFNMSRGFEEVSFIRGEDNKLFESGLDPIQFINERKHEKGVKRFTEIIQTIFDGPVAKNLSNAIYYKFKYIYRSRFGEMEPQSWDEKAIEDAQKFITYSVSNDDRFFSTVNLIGAHGPWEYNREYVENIGITPEDIAPENRWEEVASNSEAQWPYAAGEIEFDETDREILTHLYESWVNRVDELAGRLIDHLKDEGVYDDTLVIVTADHGECIARDRVLGHELTVDEEVAHVPLAVSGPGIPDETVSDPVSLKDIYGSVLTAMGIEDEERHLWNEDTRGSAFIETYPVDPDTLSEQYRDIASDFGRRCALFTTDGWAEQRHRTNNTYGDERTRTELEEFISRLEPFEATDEPNNQLSSEVEERLEELGYKS